MCSSLGSTWSNWLWTLLSKVLLAAKSGYLTVTDASREKGQSYRQFLYGKPKSPLIFLISIKCKRPRSQRQSLRCGLHQLSKISSNQLSEIRLTARLKQKRWRGVRFRENPQAQETFHNRTSLALIYVNNLMHQSHFPILAHAWCWLSRLKMFLIEDFRITICDNSFTVDQNMGKFRSRRDIRSWNPGEWKIFSRRSIRFPFLEFRKGAVEKVLNSESMRSWKSCSFSSQVRSWTKYLGFPILSRNRWGCLSSSYGPTTTFATTTAKIWI